MLSSEKRTSACLGVAYALLCQASGMTRTALRLQGQNLVYHVARHSVTKHVSLIAEENIPCGSIDLQDLNLV